MTASQAAVLDNPCTLCEGSVETELAAVYPESDVCLECMSPTDLTRLEKDLNQVQKFDRTRLAAVPALEGWEVGLHYRPSRLLSGDFYDVQGRDDGNGFRLVVGDVMGKGIPAALLRTGLEGALTALADEIPSPALVLEKINRKFFAREAPGRLASVFYGTVDDSSGELRYANAGHLPPLLRRDSGEWRALDATGMVLGALDDVPYADASVTLGRGDVLALFSDGFTEAENDAGDSFDDRGIVDRIDQRPDAPAQEIASHLASELQRFAPGEPSDDRTLLIVRRK